MYIWTVYLYSPSAQIMLTSYEVMQAANISRATLNNYIALGLLPRPLVKNPGPGAATSARQIGYFPEEVLARLERIRKLKKEGYAMLEIAQQLNKDAPEVVSQEAVVTPKAFSESVMQPVMAGGKSAAQYFTSSSSLQLTIDHIPFAAYMVNYNFEITWYNEQARNELLGKFESLPADIKGRNALTYLLKGPLEKSGVNREELIQFFLLLAKGRLSRNELVGAATGQADSPVKPTGQSLGEPHVSTPLIQIPLTLHREKGEIARYNVYASYYREGILCVYLPAQADSNDSLLGLLERRDEVIRSLLKKHLPVLTDVAVLVADLQSSVRICTELPPEEYFEMINQIWAAMEPIFRKYYGTHGKHVGDGMVYYFFPQPDCNYILNALKCAQEMKDAMRKISKEWQIRKNWLNELYLNSGLNEGQEWLGIFHIETKVEFTVLGDTINHAARLSDFARSGAIWATKNLLGKLPAETRQRIQFGIRRKDAEGREIFVAASYSRITELLGTSAPHHEKLYDIAALPITEIMKIEV